MAVCIRIQGLVQGVGFRPHVWRLAHQHQLRGTVRNDSAGVLIEAWGETAALQAFVHDLQHTVPPLARLDSLSTTPLDQPCPHDDFRIVASAVGEIHTGIVADAALCQACYADITDSTNRRYRYPFTNCTHCGPRLSIIQGIPYDRAHTSMASFQLCPACQREYTNPADRRFHAQPNACPVCGPQLWLEDNFAQVIQPSGTERDCLDTASRLLREGHIVAIMGLGGVHLACDATNAQAVAALRQRKRRPHKPLALMARDIAVIRQYCHVSAAEADLLQSKAAPVVLLSTHTPLAAPISALDALGFMLPYTPLHALLLVTWATPLVMTSANRSAEPQCISLAETRVRMQGIADYLLLHNRPIVNRVDDSVTRVVAAKPRILRRARGYAPEPLRLPPDFAAAPPLVALGGELKNTVALLRDGQVYLSQHLGDLEERRTWQEYTHTLQLYQRLFAHQPAAIAVDQHPGYRSTQWGEQWAREHAVPLLSVQHHHAHLGACLAENGWGLGDGKVLGIVLDGLGYGADGTLWGGEFLLADYHGSQRLGHLQPVAMPGGVQAILQPWRNTWAQLQRLDWAWLSREFATVEIIQYLQQQPLATLQTMVARGLNTPLSSSCGRLCDAVAAALGCSRASISYEGQAAMALEALIPAEMMPLMPPYPFALTRAASGCWQLDPAPMWYALLKDLHDGYPRAVIAAQFHQGLIQGLARLTRQLLREHPEIKAVALSGGVMQNTLLLTGLLGALRDIGLPLLTHSQVPTNDGGLALGQAAIAAAQLIASQAQS